MSHLTVHDLSDPAQVFLDTTEGEAIAQALAPHGVRFERWERERPPTEATEEDILTVYAEDVDRLKAEGGYVTADVIRLSPDNPHREAIRAKFLHEHRHAEDEVRFFVEGQGLFFLHLDDRVYRILCTADDLLSVPAGTPHWFDTGPRPFVTAIRLFTNPEGWVAQATGADHAERFPLLDA